MNWVVLADIITTVCVLSLSCGLQFVSVILPASCAKCNVTLWFFTCSWIPFYVTANCPSKCWWEFFDSQANWKGKPSWCSYFSNCCRCIYIYSWIKNLAKSNQVKVCRLLTKENWSVTPNVTTTKLKMFEIKAFKLNSHLSFSSLF